MISDASLVESDAAMDSLVEGECSDPESRELTAYENVDIMILKKVEEKEKFLIRPPR